MKKQGLIIGLLLAAAGSLFCEENVRALQLSLEPGSRWVGEGKVALFFTIEVEPSFVFWVEDSQGNYIETIYVTGKVAGSSWNGTKGRPEALPVWGHARGIANERGEYLPSKSLPLTDGQSSATPMEDFTCMWDGIKDAAPGTYHIMMEINIGFDYNNTWKQRVSRENRKFKNGVNGQPSLIYKADIKVGEDIRIEQFKVIGRGSPLGEDGEIYPLEGIDTALDIVGRLKLEALVY